MTAVTAGELGYGYGSTSPSLPIRRHRVVSCDAVTMPERAELGGRLHAPVYRVSSARGDLHAFLLEAVRRSGGEVIYASEPDRAPIFVGVQGEGDERLGVLCYPFRCNAPPIRGRAPDEHRVQVRYGGQASWEAKEHPLGHDIAGVDTTIVLGVHPNFDIFVGLDPALYDPLPMGISIELKQAQVEEAQLRGWHVWERENHPGRRRGAPRARAGLETIVAFTPERLLDYVRFERQASGLGLDQPLRFRAAEVAATDPPTPARGVHALEEEFALSSEEILEIIAHRSRLAVAVRGGVAEHHLGLHLRDDPSVRAARLIDRDGEPDFDVELTDDRRVLVECKNVSPRRYADGSPKIEVQKTRGQKADPAGRLYRPEQFDVVAACLYSVSGTWEFRFRRTREMERDSRYPERLAALHRVDDSWSASLVGALGSP